MTSMSLTKTKQGSGNSTVKGIPGTVNSSLILSSISAATARRLERVPVPPDDRLVLSGTRLNDSEIERIVLLLKSSDRIARSLSENK